MAEPISFVVDEDPPAVETLAGDLDCRFHPDYRSLAKHPRRPRLTAGCAAPSGDHVALIICYESMRAMSGSELLARADNLARTCPNTS